MATDWNNAVVKSFFAKLITELVHRQRYGIRQEVRVEILEYLE